MIHEFQEVELAYIGMVVKKATTFARVMYGDSMCLECH